MANLSGILAPHEQDGQTFTIAASGNTTKTFWPGAILQITVAAAAGAAAGVTITYGQTNAGALGGVGHTPTAASATVGQFVNANTPPFPIWLGPQRDTINIFNNTAGVVTVSIQPMSPV